MRIIDNILDYTKPWLFPDVYCFTGNPVVTLKKALVMGTGAAKQVRDSYPGVDVALAELVKLNKADEHTARDPAHLLWFNLKQLKPGHAELSPFANRADWYHQWIGWLKVKHHWKQRADLGLVKIAIHQLALAAHHSPALTYHVNYPGIGAGKLEEKHVRPLLEILPYNVLVYRGIPS